MQQKSLKKGIEELLNNSSATSSNVTMIFNSKRHKETDPFAIVLQKVLEYYVTSLTGTGMKLMMYFICQMKYGNIVEADHRDLMQKLNIGRTALSKAMAELKELGVIVIYPDLNDKRRNTYMINHYAAWKGNAGDRQQSIRRNKEIFPNPNQLLLPFSSTQEEELKERKIQEKQE